MAAEGCLTPLNLTLVFSYNQNQPCRLLAPSALNQVVPWVRSLRNSQLGMQAALCWCLLVDKPCARATPQKFRNPCFWVTRYQSLHVKVGMEPTLKSRTVSPVEKNATISVLTSPVLPTTARALITPPVTPCCPLDL